MPNQFKLAANNEKTIALPKDETTNASNEHFIEQNKAPVVSGQQQSVITYAPPQPVTAVNSADLTYAPNTAFASLMALANTAMAMNQPKENNYANCYDSSAATQEDDASNAPSTYYSINFYCPK